jgi:hypothetical protein
MAEWTVCPFCQLKHTRRPDGSCPRCHQSLEGGGGGGAEAGTEPPLASVLGGAPLGPSSYEPRGPKARSGVPLGLVIVGSFLLVSVLVVVGVVALGFLGRNMLGSLRYSGQLESTPVSVLRGDGFQYHLVPASPKWFLRKKEAARKDNPLADRWIVRPDKDAHVFVIAEHLPSAGSVDMDRFVTVVSQNARESASRFEVLSTASLSPVIASRLLEVRATFKRQNIRGYYGLYAREPYIYQVIAMASDAEFESIREDLKRTVSSFEPD